MADVFVSYSRSDAEFVGRLAEDLKDRGKEVWVDVDGIRDAEKFPEALRRAIEGSDAFVFVISPDSVGSEFCEQEVAHAAGLNKRIVPLALRRVPDEQIPEEIRFRNWISVGEDTGVERVLAAVETDLEWERQHTRLTVKALEWDKSGRDRSFLPRGSELRAAERWLAAGASKDPGPTELEQEYLLAARQAGASRQRRLVGGSLAVTAVAIGLLIFALISRSQAVSAENRATSGLLAAESQNQLSINPERAVLLAIAGVRKGVSYGTNGTMFALRAAIDASAIRYRLPSLGSAGCGGPYPQYDPARGSNLLVVGLCNGTIRFFNAATGRSERTVAVARASQPAALVQYSATGSVLTAVVGSSAPRMEALDPRTGALRRRGPVLPGLDLAAADPYGPLVAGSNAAGELELWNYASGRVTVERPNLNLPMATDFAFGPDGRLAFSLGGGSQGVAVYDYVHDRVVATSRSPSSNVVYSPDGRTLAVGAIAPDGTGTVELLDARTLALVRSFRSLPDPNEAVIGLEFNPDGRDLAYSFNDGSAGVLDARTGGSINRYFTNSQQVTGVNFSSDGRLLATGSVDGTVLAWRTGGQVLRAIAVGGSVVGLVAVRGGFVTIANPGAHPGQGVVVQRFTDAGVARGAPLVLSRSAAVNAASIDPAGAVAVAAAGVSGNASAALHEWDLQTRRIVHTISMPNNDGGIPVIGPRDRYIAASVHPSSQPGRESLEVIDMHSGRPRILAHSAGHCGFGGWVGFAFSPSDARFAAGSNCGLVSAWNPQTGRRLGGTLKVSGFVNSIAFAPDGSRLAIGTTDGALEVSHVPLTNGARILTQSTKSIQTVAYSPDGRYLASAGLDGAIRIFDARSLALLRVIRQPDPIQGVVFSADSRDVLSVDSAGAIRLWDACTDCQNPQALLALARARVTRSLTPAERRTFGVG
jgi:WD40 repeat protein